MFSCSWLCIMLPLTPHALHILISTHTYAYTLDHAELRSEVQAEQAQVEAITNLSLDQGKPRCIPPIILGFYFNHYFMLYMLVY
jgi:hypothetical protein